MTVAEDRMANDKEREEEEVRLGQTTIKHLGRVAMALTIVGDDLEGNRGQDKEEEEREDHCRRRKSWTEASIIFFDHLPCNNQPYWDGKRVSVR
jgi:hypothetical protein